MSSYKSRTQKAQFQVRPLIGALALALAAPAAFAATLTPPAAGALPGTFYNNVGASYAATGAVGAISYSNTGAAVMQWGGTFTGATSVSPTLTSGATTVAGFNIGAGATLNINNGATTGAGLLISDVTGQASQIYGTLSATNVGPLFIANANGVVLGGTVNNIGSGVGILGFAQDAATFAGTATVNVPVGQTLVNKGDVTVNGTIAASTVLIAGAGNVNVSQSGAAADGWNIVAGENFTFDGATVTATNGAFVGGSTTVVNLAGGASTGSAAFTGAIVNAAGNVNLSNYVGVLSSSSVVAGTLTNNGVLSAATLAAGSIVNNGMINATGALDFTASTGDVTNNGIINASGAVTLAAANTSGNVTNNGSILKAGDVTLSAGTSAGTAVNNGTINFATVTPSSTLTMGGFNVNLYGTVNANVSSAATALSATNSLGPVSLSAVTAGGVLNLGTTLFASGGSTLNGGAVRVVSGGLTDAAGVTVNIGSGAVTSGANTYGYNLSVFNGATLSAGTGTMTVAGATGASGSNINLDGTLAGQTIGVTANNINGLGGFNITTSGGALTATFSGNFNAPNGAAARSGAGNFLYNYVPVNVASNGSATINLNPTNTANAQQNVNVLVNGSAILTSGLTTPVDVNGSIVAQSSAPNSHLVVQATGNLTIGTPVTTPPSVTTNFYWPGLMYLGTINAGQPGSLSTLGTITLNGLVSNVIRTNVASEGGIWFMTNNPLLSGQTGAQVLTNTNSWINFPAASGLAAAYATNNAGFYGMTVNPTVNTILNTSALASDMFHGR